MTTNVALPQYWLREGVKITFRYPGAERWVFDLTFDSDHDLLQMELEWDPGSLDFNISTSKWEEVAPVTPMQVMVLCQGLRLDNIDGLERIDFERVGLYTIEAIRRLEQSGCTRQLLMLDD